MNPSSDDLHPTDAEIDALLAFARADKPDTSRAEYAFETRLMARLNPRGPVEWLCALAWRLTPYFAAFALAVALWTRFAPPPAEGDPTETVLEWSASAEDDLGGFQLDDLFS